MVAKRLFFVLLLTTLGTSLLVISPSVGAREGPKPAAVGLRPDAPPYALHGPYWVGTREFVISEGRENPLTVHAWYPALNPTGVAEEITYKAVLKDPTVADPNVDMFGHALLEAAPDAAAAPYPLVVFSHGFGTSAYAYAHLTEHYASYGFVVLAPEHQEVFDFAFTDFPRSSIERPRDIKQVLDYAETLTAAGGTMERLIDMEHVAVAGHSYGGYTALASAGARYDLKPYNARCTAATPAEYAWLCAPLVPYESEMAKLAGLDPMPEGLWPSFGDSRVDAIIPMAGDSYLFDQAGLAEITIPIMAMGGTLDTGTPYEWGAHPAYQYASSATKALVAFENAEHMIFGINIKDAPYLLGPDWTDWAVFYIDAVWDKDRVHDLIHHFSTAFLLATLKGDTEAAAALAPNAVSFPGITYEAQGF